MWRAVPSAVSIVSPAEDTAEVTSFGSAHGGAAVLPAAADFAAVRSAVRASCFAWAAAAFAEATLPVAAAPAPAAPPAGTAARRPPDHHDDRRGDDDQPVAAPPASGRLTLRGGCRP